MTNWYSTCMSFQSITSMLQVAWKLCGSNCRNNSQLCCTVLATRCIPVPVGVEPLCLSPGCVRRDWWVPWFHCPLVKPIWTPVCNMPGIFTHWKCGPWWGVSQMFQWGTTCALPCQGLVRQWHRWWVFGFSPMSAKLWIWPLICPHAILWPFWVLTWMRLSVNAERCGPSSPYPVRSQPLLRTPLKMMPIWIPPR